MPPSERIVYMRAKTDNNFLSAIEYGKSLCAFMIVIAIPKLMHNDVNLIVYIKFIMVIIASSLAFGYLYSKAVTFEICNDRFCARSSLMKTLPFVMSNNISFNDISSIYLYEYKSYVNIVFTTRFSYKTPDPTITKKRMNIFTFFLMPHNLYHFFWVHKESNLAEKFNAETTLGSFIVKFEQENRE